MIVPSKNQKTYGVLHTENYFSFLGFCKKVNSDKIQKVDVLIDNLLIDTIIADKHIQKIEDIYELEGFGFSYDLPKKYVGQKSIISFKNHETKEHLQNSPYELIDLNNYNFNEINFIHSLSLIRNIKITKEDYSKNTISFIAIKENIEDIDFINFINSLATKFPLLYFKIFYFNEEQKQCSEKIFENIKNKGFFIPKKIDDILMENEIYIHHYISNFMTKFSEQFYWNTRELIRLENKLFILDLVKKSDKNLNITLLSDNNINFNNSIISKIFENHEKVRDYSFTNSLYQPINKEALKNTSNNSIGFLSSEENLKSPKFVNYIKELMIKFPNVQIKSFIFNESQEKLANETFNDIKSIYISNITEIANEIEIFIWDTNNYLDLKIVQNFLKNVEHIFPIYNFNNAHFINLEGKTLCAFDDFYKNKNELILKNPESVGFTNEEISLNKDSYHQLVYGSLMSRELKTTFEIDLNTNALEFLLFTQLELALNYKNFKKDFIKMHKLRNGY